MACSCKIIPRGYFLAEFSKYDYEFFESNLLFWALNFKYYSKKSVFIWYVWKFAEGDGKITKYPCIALNEGSRWGV